MWLGVPKLWAAAHNAGIAISENVYAIPYGATLESLRRFGDLNSGMRALEFLTFGVVGLPKKFRPGRVPRRLPDPGDGAAVRWYEWRWDARPRVAVELRVVYPRDGGWYYFDGGADSDGDMVRCGPSVFGELTFCDFEWCRFIIPRSWAPEEDRK